MAVVRMGLGDILAVAGGSDAVWLPPPLLIIDSVLMSALLGRSRDGSDTKGRHQKKKTVFFQKNSEILRPPPPLSISEAPVFSVKEISKLARPPPHYGIVQWGRGGS